MDHLKLLAHQELFMPGFGGQCWQFYTTGFLSRLHVPKICETEWIVPNGGLARRGELLKLTTLYGKATKWLMERPPQNQFS